MDQLLITTAKLVPYPKRGGSIVSLATPYHNEASASQTDLGDLCAVVEVLAPSKQAGEVTNLILSTAQQTYYQASETDMDPAERFERAVKSVNRELAGYATHGHSAWIGKVSAVLAVIAGPEVHVTQTGSAHGFLYRGGRGTCITTGLTSKEPHRPSKTFGNIASGQLHSGDRLMLGTPALLHQLTADELAGIISDNSSAAAVAKLQQLLKDGDSQDRIAATISQVTTAEAAAMVPQSGLPREAHLGKPEGLAQVAKDNAAPYAKTAFSKAVKFGQFLRGFYQTKLAPSFKTGSLAFVRWLRKRLKDRRGRLTLGIGTIIAVAAIIWLVGNGGQNRALASLAADYKAAYAKQTTASTQLADGDKLGAKSNYQASLKQLDGILKDPKSTQLDAYLADRPHSDSDPASASKLRQLVSDQMDQIDGLTKVNPGQLADFAALGNAKPTMMIQVGDQFVFVDPSAGSIYRYNLAKAKLEVVANRPSGLGKVVSLAASANADGVYLLSDAPAVWLYTLADSKLTKLTITGGNWPKAQAVAHYGGNLYTLASDSSAIYKQGPATGGFAAPIAYALNDPSVLKNAKTITVDGNIYVGSDKGFTRIFAGVVQKSDLAFPTNLLNPRTIVSTNQGKLLIVTDAASNRIGIFNFSGALEYSRQLAVKDAKIVYAASSDNQENVLYALVDQKFVKLKY